MARGKGTTTPRENREKSDEARESRQKESTERQSEQSQNENQEWWRNEGGGEGEVY